MKKIIFIMILSLFIMTGISSATPITYYFSGDMTCQFGTVEQGTLFNGHFSYDDPAPIDPATVSHAYQSESGYVYRLTDFSVLVGTTQVNGGADSFFQIMNDTWWGEDRLFMHIFTPNTFLGGGLLNGINIYFNDLSSTVFNDNSYPGATLTSYDFDQWCMDLIGGSGQGQRWGMIDYLSTTWPIPEGYVPPDPWWNTSPTTAPVPEPTAIFLLGSGILGIAGLRKKLNGNKR